MSIQLALIAIKLKTYNGSKCPLSRDLWKAEHSRHFQRWDRFRWSVDIGRNIPLDQCIDNTSITKSGWHPYIFEKTKISWRNKTTYKQIWPCSWVARGGWRRPCDGWSCWPTPEAGNLQVCSSSWAGGRPGPYWKAEQKSKVVNRSFNWEVKNKMKVSDHLHWHVIILN